MTDREKYQQDFHEMEKKIAEFGDLLRVDMPSAFKQVVLVQHMDGSTLLFTSASFWENESFLAVFTEHLGYHWFSKGDLDRWRYWLENPQARSKDPGPLRLPRLRRENAAAVQRAAKDIATWRRRQRSGSSTM